MKRRKFTQDAANYSSFDWTNDGVNNELEEIRNSIPFSSHTATESVLSETMDLFTNTVGSKDIEWLNKESGANEYLMDGSENDDLDSDDIVTSEDDETQIQKRFDFAVDSMDSDNDNGKGKNKKKNKNKNKKDKNKNKNKNRNNNDSDLSQLTESVSLKHGRSKTKGDTLGNNRRPKVKKYHTIGNLFIDEQSNDDLDEDGYHKFGGGHSRTSTGRRSMRLNGLQSIVSDEIDNIEYDNFDFNLFAKDNQSLDIRRRDKPGNVGERVLSSEYLTFELDKECEALEAMLNKIRQENELLHEIPSLNLKDMDMLEMVLTQLSEYSLSYSNQSMVLEIACDILKEITEIPQMGNRNESRAQCVEYQASVIDIGKTSCIQDAEIWQNNVWCNDDFVSQTKFDFNVMKLNRINENRPRDLYTDLKHKTLTIHDPTTKGRNKDNKVFDSSLIKSINYTQNVQSPDYDTISLTYWKENAGKNKRHFQCLAQKYVGHRFITLMKTYISPSKMPHDFKFGQGLLINIYI